MTPNRQSQKHALDRTGVPASGYGRHRPPATSAKKPLGACTAWFGAHKAATAVGAGLLLVGAVVAAAVLIQQDATISPSAKAATVAFGPGTDYNVIQVAGFAAGLDVSNPAAATLSVSGVAGAASVSLGKVLKLTNNDGAHAQTLTLSVGGTINSRITSFVVTVAGSAGTVSWDAVAGGASAPLVLPAGEAADVSFAMVISGTTAATFGAFTLHVNIVPA